MMSLFEDWYKTYCWNPDVDDTLLEDDLLQNADGEYFYQDVFWMHKAFLAGQVLKEKKG